jgi:hypothetical protein
MTMNQCRADKSALDQLDPQQKFRSSSGSTNALPISAGGTIVPSNVHEAGSDGMSFADRFYVVRTSRPGIKRTRCNRHPCYFRQAKASEPVVTGKLKLFPFPLLVLWLLGPCRYYLVCCRGAIGNRRFRTEDSRGKITRRMRDGWQRSPLL